MDAINWSSSIFELRPGVGESLGSSSSLGFKRPKITSLALALVFLVIGLYILRVGIYRLPSEYPSAF